MGLFRRLDPLPVEICSWQVAAVVSDDDTVDVEHGDDFEDEVLAKHAGCGAVANQEVDYVLYDETWHCLAWVDSGGQYDCFLLLIGGLTDSKIVATMDITKKILIPRLCQAQELALEPILFHRIHLNRPQIPLQMSIRIRIAMGNQHVIIIMLKFYGKRETAVEATIFSFQICCVVTYIIPVTIPTDILGRGIFLWVKQGLHTHVVETIRFEQVDYVETVLYVFAGIGDGEKVPLSVSIGIEIGRQD